MDIFTKLLFASFINDRNKLQKILAQNYLRLNQKATGTKGLQIKHSISSWLIQNAHKIEISYILVFFSFNPDKDDMNKSGHSPLYLTENFDLFAWLQKSKLICVQYMLH